MADPKPVPPSDATRHFLTFRIEDRLYAMPARDVAEVIRVPSVARMPQSPDALLGLANLRGAILPVASGRSLIGCKRDNDVHGRAIVMNSSAPVALAVDAVAELVRLAVDSIETRKSELAALPGEILTGAFQAKKDGPVIKVLDVSTLLKVAFVARERPGRNHSRTIANSAVAESLDSNFARTKLVAFAVADQDYALPLEVVQEVVSAPSLLATVPHSEALVLGVTSLRDKLLPLLSLRGLLGFGANPDPQKEKVVVATVQGNTVGLVVDEMRDIFSAEEHRMDPVPGVLAARVGGESRIASIYRGGNGRGLVSILSPDQIFGDEVMQRLANAQNVVVTTEATAVAAEVRQFLVFRLGGEEYGLPIGAVEEVARVPDKVARVPNTPKFLEGVINLRGEVIPVVDQRKRFQLTPFEHTATRRLIVVRSDRHIAGLIVDSVSEVLRASVDNIEVTPDLTGETTKLVMGVVNLDAQNRIVLLLDPAELLTRAERGLLDKFSKQQAIAERSHS